MNTHIIHLKNIIIFKILIYILCTTFFFVFLPTSEKMLQDATHSANLAEEQLMTLENKVAFVKDSTQKIEQSYQAYLEQIKSSFDLSCFLHTTLNDSYIELGKKFNLGEKPTLYSSTEQSTEDLNKLQDVKILTTNIMLTFKAVNIQESINFIKQAYMHLPQYSIITSFDIDDPDIITPSSIEKLEVNTKPSIVTCKSNMVIREIKLKDL